MDIVAHVAVALFRDGERVHIAAGEPLPELSADEVRDLLDAGALNIETLKASIASQADATRAGAGLPGTNTSGSGSSAAPVAMAAGAESESAFLEVRVGGAGEPLPGLPAEYYAPDSVPIDTSPARPDESVPELAREHAAPADQSIDTTAPEPKAGRANRSK